MNHNKYTYEYIHKALNEEKLEAPDPAQANGTMEVLQSLYRANQKGGPEAANVAWNHIIKLSPETAELLNKPKKRVYHYSELKDLPALEWLIPNQLPKNASAEIHGAPGVGKSFFTLDLAAQIATEKPVLYMTTGEGVSGYSKRTDAWISYNDLIPQHLHFCEEPINLMDQGAVSNFMDDIRYLDPCLIIFDTLARSMLGADENSSRDMGLVIASCDRIIRNLKATVALVHHTGKSGTSARGSSALRGACDTMILVTEDNGIIQIENVKQKDGKRFDTMQKVLVEVDDTVVIIDASEDQIESNDLKDNDKEILDLLCQSIYQTDGLSRTEIESLTGISAGSVGRALSKLKTKGYIYQSQPRKPYQITDDGIELLKTLR